VSGLVLRSPRCPGCDTPPVFAFDAQGFCGTSDCQVVTWDRTDRPETFKAKAVKVDLSPLLGDNVVVAVPVSKPAEDWQEFSKPIPEMDPRHVAALDHAHAMSRDMASWAYGYARHLIGEGVGDMEAFTRVAGGVAQQLAQCAGNPSDAFGLAMTTIAFFATNTEAEPEDQDGSA